MRGVGERPGGAPQAPAPPREPGDTRRAGRGGGQSGRGATGARRRGAGAWGIGGRAPRRPSPASPPPQAPALQPPPPPTASSSSRQTRSPRLEPAPPGLPGHSHGHLLLARLAVTRPLPWSPRRCHWPGLGPPRPRAAPLGAPTEPRHARAPAERRRPPPVAQAAVPQPQPGRPASPPPRRRPAADALIGRKCRRSGPNSDWVGLFRFSREEGGLRPFRNSYRIGRCPDTPSTGWRSAPPVSAGGGASLLLSVLGEPRQPPGEETPAGAADRVSERARVSAPAQPSPREPRGCHGDQTLLTVLPP